jgi:hypothetical protein
MSDEENMVPQQICDCLHTSAGQKILQTFLNIGFSGEWASRELQYIYNYSEALGVVPQPNLQRK